MPDEVDRAVVEATGTSARRPLSRSRGRSGLERPDEACSSLPLPEPRTNRHLGVNRLRRLVQAQKISGDVDQGPKIPEQLNISVIRRNDVLLWHHPLRTVRHIGGGVH